MLLCLFPALLELHVRFEQFSLNQLNSYTVIGALPLWTFENQYLKYKWMFKYWIYLSLHYGPKNTHWIQFYIILFSFLSCVYPNFNSLWKMLIRIVSYYMYTYMFRHAEMCIVYSIHVHVHVYVCSTLDMQTFV